MTLILPNPHHMKKTAPKSDFKSLRGCYRFDFTYPCLVFDQKWLLELTLLFQGSLPNREAGQKFYFHIT